MRAYFVGAQSTGKSTLARHIAEQYGLPLITEVVRELKAKHELASLDTLRVDLASAAAFQAEIMRLQLAKEKEVGDDFVSDRACDFLAYTALHTTSARSLLTSQSCQDYLSDLRQPGRLVFFVRPHQAMVRRDHDRSALDCEWEEVCRVDGSIETILETQGVPYLPVASRGMKDRVRLVGGILDLAMGIQRCTPTT